MQYGTLACQHSYLIINIIKRGTNAPRVAHREHLSAAGKTTHHIATVEVGHCGLEHIAHKNMFVDIVGDANTMKSLVFGIIIVALHLTV